MKGTAAELIRGLETGRVSRRELVTRAAGLGLGDTTQARAQQPNLGYVVPREGGTIWTDSRSFPGPLRTSVRRMSS
jgi:hypothetical protein